MLINYEAAVCVCVCVRVHMRVRMRVCEPVTPKGPGGAMFVPDRGWSQPASQPTGVTSLPAHPPAHLVLALSGGPGLPVPPSSGLVSSTLMWYSVSGSRCPILWVGLSTGVVSISRPAVVRYSTCRFRCHHRGGLAQGPPPPPSTHLWPCPHSPPAQ